MFLRNIRKLLSVGTDIAKCDIRNFQKIADANTKEAIGKRMKVQGWVRAHRKMKSNDFLDITDGSTSQFLQVVIRKSNVPDNLSYGCSVSVEGELDKAPDGRPELRADSISVLGSCNVMDGYPFVPRKIYSEEYTRQYLHLRPRTRTFSSVLRLRDLATATINSHLRSRGFINIHTPVLTSNDCEGAGEVFIVQPFSKEILKDMSTNGVPEDESYFNTKAFLTVSGQLHLEVLARALTRVYTFGPTFRSENSKSRLHLSEFYMVETELAFVTKIEEITEEAEHLVKVVVKNIFEEGTLDTECLNAAEPQWLHKPFGYMTYDDAINILSKHSDQLKIPVKYGDALSKEHELFLVKYNDNVPVFVINWPAEIKPFYMKECESDPLKVAAMDLLVPEVGELIGGSLREDNYEKLQSKTPPLSDLSWYLDLRKYGNVPTGGFGLGFERFLQSILGIANIKDTIPFPRWPHNCSL